MKIKVFEKQDHYVSYDDSYTVLSRGITDWEECTPEEYELLKQLGAYVILREVEPEEYNQTVKTLVEKAKKQQQLIKAREEAYKKQSQEREEKALQRKLAKAKKLLEEHAYDSK